MGSVLTGLASVSGRCGSANARHWRAVAERIGRRNVRWCMGFEFGEQKAEVTGGRGFVDPTPPAAGFRRWLGTRVAARPRLEGEDAGHDFCLAEVVAQFPQENWAARARCFGAGITRAAKNWGLTELWARASCHGKVDLMIVLEKLACPTFFPMVIGRAMDFVETHGRSDFASAGRGRVARDASPWTSVRERLKPRRGGIDVFRELQMVQGHDVAPLGLCCLRACIPGAGAPGSMTPPRWGFYFVAATAAGAAVGFAASPFSETCLRISVSTWSVSMPSAWASKLRITRWRIAGM